MIDIFSLWEKFIGVANTFQGGHVKPQRQFVNWVNDISKELFTELAEEAEKSHTTNDLLSPFLRSTNVLVTKLPGNLFDLVIKPPDYERFSSCRSYIADKKFYGHPELPILKYNTTNTENLEIDEVLTDEEREYISQKATECLKEIRIEKIPSSKWGSALTHKNTPPSLKNAKCTAFERGLKLAPKNIPIVVLDYYRLPKEAVFNYTLSNPGTETEYIAFVPAGSVHLEWSSTLTSEFLTRLLRRYGKYVKERETVLNTVGELK